jgi:hypothetical protein
MVACLVKAGLFKTWEEAFEKGVKPRRTCTKLNKRMKENLTAWQTTYMDKVATSGSSPSNSRDRKKDKEMLLVIGKKDM